VNVPAASSNSTGIAKPFATGIGKLRPSGYGLVCVIDVMVHVPLVAPAHDGASNARPAAGRWSA
jgi:hypothetical protein